ncbi:bifunctional glutamate N-acetyltransferase/amino-acid acetyltransferase ArgJ [Prochlorococcus marinus]|uniref:Arginine biosynthesis bifunctional protein ArgJ n=1 Tax=Prochlorococcus marinus XMU1408 TaxID=2213228 RepID=A0A318R3K5_PROMR|nr:bifunctional glutamate N-acetyltransferase/amino-acid acetyltransferase ArgJ [Prochlorococcus marinus]MBW3041055.1 arginine biosynthesis bifunctional protein ArgJ [Prochlorococcus marinus str. XMU1408]PYE03644.1 arginine biosynthesis bifunctional protein ArgJ [Prochlorococcus marinus XMU1408]
MESSIWSPISGGISSPDGFLAAGISAGLKPSAKKDLALLYAPEGSCCSGTFTKSVARAYCVDLCIDRLKVSKGKIRAVVINSGHANACTGGRGKIDSEIITHEIAKRMGLSDVEVLICSTGVIGEPIPLERVNSHLDLLIKSLEKNVYLDAANAILTTDLKVKQIAYEAVLGGRRICIGGMAKGSGMIHPSMATMLSYITCDVGVDQELWSDMIKRVANSSFNAITVDGDTSTNDTFLAFSSGRQLDQRFLSTLEEGLHLTAQYLAKSIARDGEGANCLLEIKVDGAQSDLDAHLKARTIASSSLVKTAVHGSDPNWGRIIAALGCAGEHFNLSDVTLWIGPYEIFANGVPLDFDRQIVSNFMKARLQGKYLMDDLISIRLRIGIGKGSATAWGCDLSDQYVRINADYTT